jgi:hypothetical protein
MSGAGSVLQIPQVWHQALGLTSGDDLLWKSDKRGDARGRPSWGSSLLGDPSAKFFVKKLELRWFDPLCGAGCEEVVQ